jgi:hypothetical protein
MKAAGLSGQLADDAPRGSMLDAYWGVVFKWNERSRYRRVDAREARELLEAITEQHDGVFQWLQRYW